MIVGMDFGTTNSGMAVYDGARVSFIPLEGADGGASIARTALYITNERQVYLGRGAIDIYYEQNLNRPVKMEKVKVGEVMMTFAELPSFVRDVYVDMDALSPGRLFLSFKMSLPTLDYAGTVVGSHFYFLEDIIALYLYMTKQRAEAYTGQEIKRIVLGRPVHFAVDPKDDEVAWQRLLKAAFRAGYEEVYFQYEPVAAAYHYASTVDDDQTILVFDFGGGTLDVSILRVGKDRRKVLATGGVPIAGDIFDQKLVRAKMPPHFGEGSTYRAASKILPVPSAFYEAFSNWQDLLALHRHETLESLQKIERTAQKPLQIRALRHLISSSYGLKMYDAVEAAKRQLSTVERTYIRLHAPNVNVVDPVTRAEFEAVIGSEIRAIETFLADILQNANLKPSDIDVVIRTGGSSLIPAFVNMLERTFGADKVRSLDEFSSVTAGLAIIAHQIEHGELNAKRYRREDYPVEEPDQVRDGIPAIDFETMKKFITISEQGKAPQSEPALVGLTEGGDVIASEFSSDKLDFPAFKGQEFAALTTLPADAPLILCTTEYRLLRRTARELAQLRELEMTLADAAGFYSDSFGSETISGMGRLANDKADQTLLVTSVGAFKFYARAPLYERLEQTIPYQIARLKGDPVALFDVCPDDEILAFSTSGKVVRLTVSTITRGEGRLMNLNGDERILTAFAVRGNAPILLADADATIKRLNSGGIERANTLNTPGIKIVQARLKGAIPFDPRRTTAALTTRRAFALSEAHLAKSRVTLQLAPNESIQGLFAFDIMP